MKHLEAFKSSDAVSGRVWTDGLRDFRRVGDRLESRYNSNYDGPSQHTYWLEMAVQVVAMNGDVRWVDQVSMAIAFRALADGDTLIGERGFKIRLNGERIERFNGAAWSDDDGDAIFDYAPWKIDTDASISQGDEPQLNVHIPAPMQTIEIKADPSRPPLEIGDRVRVAGNSLLANGELLGSLGTIQAIKGDGDVMLFCDFDKKLWWFASGDLEKVDSETKGPEYPLTYEQARRAAWHGEYVACEKTPDIACRIMKSVDQIFCPIHNMWEDANNDEFAESGEKDAKWRVIPHGQKDEAK